MRPRSGAFCLLLVVLCLAGAPPARTQTSTLRLSLPISTDSPIGQNVRDFAREVEARTRGAVKIEFQDKVRNYEENEVVSAVASGAIEMGATQLNQFAYDVPLAGAFLQPFMFNFDALVQAATKRRQRDPSANRGGNPLLDQRPHSVVAALRFGRHLFEENTGHQSDGDRRSRCGYPRRPDERIDKNLRR